MAFDAGQGRTAVPVRTALAGIATAVGALVAALVFGSSLIGLVTTPGRYGQNWDQKLDAGYADVPGQKAAQLLSGISGLTAWAAGENGVLSVDGVQVPAIALDPLGQGTGYLTALDGRLPSGPDQIALGTQTLRALHRSVGQTVRVRVTFERRGGGAARHPDHADHRDRRASRVRPPGAPRHRPGHRRRRGDAAAVGNHHRHRLQGTDHLL